jgi:hypothetical protein
MDFEKNESLRTFSLVSVGGRSILCCEVPLLSQMQPKIRKKSLNEMILRYSKAVKAKLEDGNEPATDPDTSF